MATELDASRPPTDEECGAAALAHKVPEFRSRKYNAAVLLALLAAAMLCVSGVATVRAASTGDPPAGGPTDSLRRQLTAWDKEYSREPLIKQTAANQAEMVNKEVQAKIRISFDEFPTEEQQVALKQALIKEMKVQEEDVTDFHVSRHQDGAYNIVPDAKEEMKRPAKRRAVAKAVPEASKPSAASKDVPDSLVPCDIVITVKQDTPELAEKLKQRTDAKFIDAEHECEYLASHTGMPSYSCQWTVQRINDDDWDDDWISNLQKDGHDVMKLGPN